MEYLLKSISERREDKQTDYKMSAYLKMGLTEGATV